MRRSSRVASPALWAATAAMTLLSTTLLSLLLAAPASADTVRPVRHCSFGDRYVDLRGERSAVAKAPEGFLVAAFCVDSDGRRGGSELHVLSTPQRSAAVRHSDGRRLEGYSVTYVEMSSADGPEAADDDDDESDEDEDDRGDGRETAAPGAGKSAKAEPKDEAKGSSSSPKADEGEQGEAERTPSASASEPEPSRSATAATIEQSEGASQLSALGGDGEKLRTTAYKETTSKVDDDALRSLIVAGGIILVGLIAGGIALLVRLPGQR